jgi:DNA-binding CsgD family transcriptional regulator
MSNYILQHPGLNYADEIAQICSPLEKLNITYFAHIKINSAGEFSGLSNNPAFTEHYLNNKYYNADIHLAEKKFGDYILWDAMERTKRSEKMHNEAAAFGVQHTFTIIENSKDDTHYYHFANNSDSKSINQFYITHIDILKLYISHFKNSINQAKHLNYAYDHKFNIDNNAEGFSIKDSEILIQNDSSISTFMDLLNTNNAENIQFPFALIHKECKKPVILSPQQMKCLQYLIAGNSIKHIGRKMALSPRTIEHYLNAVKKILGCKNNKDLVSSYYSQAINPI